MTEPKRIQRKRTRGWKMPENTVYVGRPSKWGNPFEVKQFLDHWLVIRGGKALFEFSSQYPKLYAMLQSINCYMDYIDAMTTSERSDFLSGLQGKNLACWCPLDQPCHADVLLELANSEATR